MALVCGHCGSAEGQPLADSHQCPNCGGRTYFDGEPVEGTQQVEVQGDQFTTTADVASTESEQEEGEHVCEECGKAFSSPQALGGHKASHS